MVRGNIYDKYNGDRSVCFTKFFRYSLQNLKRNRTRGVNNLQQSIKLSIGDYEKQVKFSLIQNHKRINLVRKNGKTFWIR